MDRAAPLNAAKALLIYYASCPVNQRGQLPQKTALNAQRLPQDFLNDISFTRHCQPDMCYFRLPVAGYISKLYRSAFASSNE
ncbi:MAG: hypothetical protein COA29_01690 [Porticoccus sp.]|nr:hypothetical protein [Porticoccus sp.]PHQ58271.1 MAG: hypothetical protein COA29_01690 [Porticoccus sp.]